MPAITNVGDMLRPTHDEANYQRFVSVLRKKILVDFAQDMRAVYEHKVEPEFERRRGRKPRDHREIRQAMRHEPVFEAWSSLRYTAQQMTWWSVQPAVERQLPELIRAARDADAARPAGGSLRLDPDLAIPRYVSELDVHLMPGCFQAEHTEDDVAQGALYHYGTSVFSGGLAHRMRNKGGVASSIASFVKLRFPDFAPRRILDMGCTAGANTLPYAEAFPAAEVHGIDVAPPPLRFAHARAEAEGYAVHFSQQNAEATDFPDDSFDFISSSFFFHELSVKATRNVLRECRRILRPGGLVLHMELPPVSETDPYYNFYLDWDAYYNNEPHYAAFRALDFRKTLQEAGFAADEYVQFRIPNVSSTDPEEFAAVARGGETARREHGIGAVWFTFGGWKSS